MEGSTAVLTVQDTGPGIPASDRENVMRRFYRAEASRHTSGHGLGLSIVGAIVRLHDFRLILRDPPWGSGAVIAILAGPDDGGRAEPALRLPSAADIKQPAPA